MLSISYLQIWHKMSLDNNATVVLKRNITLLIARCVMQTELNLIVIFLCGAATIYRVKYSDDASLLSSAFN